MSIEARIFSGLTGHAGLAALVASRIYPMRLPERATLPALTYQRVSTLPIQTRDSTATLMRPRFQFDIWAEAFDDVAPVRVELVEALLGLEALSGIRTNVVLANDQDLFEPETERYHTIVDAFVWHENEES